MYCQLAALNLSDPIFHASNFARLPVRLISEVLNNNAKLTKMRVNANSVSTAKLGAMVATAFGSKNTKVKITDFLPYETEEGEDGVTNETREALKWALRTQKMPATIVAMLGSELS